MPIYIDKSDRPIGKLLFVAVITVVVALMLTFTNADGAQAVLSNLNSY